MIPVDPVLGLHPDKVAPCVCRHQREVGTGYFDTISTVVSQGQSSTTALRGSTETEQFHD